ncbi:hypothetical protein OHT52_06295 [Streptomyces sp. NBC_00247]|uniref:hypothetical protein n=1 Tax=Streptomyces sp. NBC_00247 TaxID=2975689 RepID=UPI002E2BD674|nr:hypothetical protein [Streptomyces sp. NBC_00247]
MAAKKNAEADKGERWVPCTCSQFSTGDGKTTGCVATTTRQFAPGHDAKLKSFLIKAGAGAQEVTRTRDGIVTSGQAATMADGFKFGYMVQAGVARAKDKAAEAAIRAERKAEERAAKKAAEDETA